MIDNNGPTNVKNPLNPQKWPTYSGPRFGAIVMDPPWDIQQNGNRGARQHYDTMTLDQISQLPISEIAADNAHLWLWITNAVLPYAFALITGWGFVFRSPLVWIKPHFTLGNYLRNANEILLFATRGNAPVQFRSQPTWMYAPLAEHSRKPEEQFAIIERVSGPGPKLELFARRRPPQIEGSPWSVWGNEIDSDITIPGFPVPSDFDEQEV